MKFYFTFGQIHTHSINGKTLDKNWVIEIEKETSKEARDLMFETFGKKWSTQYNYKPDMSFFPSGIYKLS